jgi:hypothetical protein
MGSLMKANEYGWTPRGGLDAGKTKIVHLRITATGRTAIAEKSLVLFEADNQRSKPQPTAIGWGRHLG